MINYKGLEFTRQEIEASIKVLEKSAKPTKELVLESLDIPDIFVAKTKILEARISELKELLNG